MPKRKAEPEEPSSGGGRLSEARPAGTPADPEPKRVRFNPVVEEHTIDPDGDQEMAVSMVERMYQDDLKWTLGSVDDMCAKDDPEMDRMVKDFAYYDEITWEPLNAKDVQKGEREEYERFCKMGVYEYAPRAAAHRCAAECAAFRCYVERVGRRSFDPSINQLMDPWNS